MKARFDGTLRNLLEALSARIRIVGWSKIESVGQIHILGPRALFVRLRTHAGGLRIHADLRVYAGFEVECLTKWIYSLRNEVLSNSLLTQHLNTFLISLKHISFLKHF